MSTTGQDDMGRDGLSPANAWKSLAYACEQVPEGAAVIQLGEGTFTATKTAVLKSGFTLVGQGANKTTVTNAASFTASPDAYCNWSEQAPNYLVSVPSKRKDVVIKDILFTSSDENPLYGAIHVWDSDRIEVKNVTIRNFSWAGLYLNRSGKITVKDCQFEDASYEKHCNEWGGGMRTRYVEDMELSHCEFKTTKGGGYGYKASGHENAKIHDNIFHNKVTLDSTSGRPFDLESAHEFEWGLEIYNNVFNGMVSVPRAGNQKHPSDRGDYTYTVRIHDNVFYGSGGVEGPRNYLEIDHNYFAQKWGNSGRVFEIHGGENAGPTKIHHNVAECSMGFVFKKNELNENISILNNTVYLVNSDRNNFPTSFLEVSGAVKNWQIKNNIVFSVDAQSPNKPSAFSRGSLPETGLDISHNVAWKVANIPSVVSESNPQLALRGEKPRAYYAPSGAESYVVDRGTEVGFPFEGSAPDLGAYEWSAAQTPEPTADDPSPSQPEPSDTTVVTSIDPASGSPEEEFIIYPNPASRALTVHRAAGHPTAFSAELLNVLGVPLAKRHVLAGDRVAFDLTTYAPGIYFLRLRAAGQETIQRVIKR
ncbi:MAG: right-handed parallel beta-helix repeat-containing protein [Tunicatimonas sp.]